jgi:tetratricopeptide (TPR) repeat protein
MNMRGRLKLAFLAALGVCAIAHFGRGRLLNAAVQYREGAESPSQLFQSAVKDYEAGKFVEAEQILLPLLESSPQSFDVNELMGLVLVGERKDAEALIYLKNAVHANPASPPAHIACAGCLVRLGRLAAAEAELQKASALKPSDYDSNHDLGELYVQIGKLASAIPYLEKAQVIQPSSYDNGYDLALADLRTRKPREARNLLQSLLGHKDTAELHNLLGEADERSGDYLEAVKEFEKAAHMDPSEGNILDWGAELLVHHTFQPAIQVFTFGTEKYPSSVKMELGLGLAYYGLASFEKAAGALMRATDLAPRDPGPYLILGETYNDSRIVVQGVVDRLDRLTSLDPTNAHAFYYQALALWKAAQAAPGGKDFSKVESALEKAATLNPKFADPQLQLGNLYSDENKISEAVAAYQEALRIDPNLADAHYRLGQLYRRTGKSVEARKELALYQRLHEAQITEKDKKHEQMQRFVITMSR